MLVVPLISAPLVIGLIGFWIFGEKKRKRFVPNKNMMYKLFEKKEGD